MGSRTVLSISELDSWLAQHVGLQYSNLAHGGFTIQCLSIVVNSYQRSEKIYIRLANLPATVLGSKLSTYSSVSDSLVG